MDELLLDSDILSEVAKRKNKNVLTHANRYLAVRPKLTFSLVTKFEVLRGLKWKAATVQLAQFTQICADSIILPIDDEVVERPNFGLLPWTPAIRAATLTSSSPPPRSNITSTSAPETPTTSLGFRASCSQIGDSHERDSATLIRPPSLADAGRSRSVVGPYQLCCRKRRWNRPECGPSNERSLKPQAIGVGGR